MFKFSLNFNIDKEWDLIVIGGGIAGITSTIYSHRYGLKTLLITENIGGLANYATIVENYPGLIGEGKELVNKWEEHLKKLNCNYLIDKVIDIQKENNYFLIKTLNKEFKSKAIILAMGSSKKKLNIPGEKEFSGKGVSYCATCDSTLFKNKIVAVIGGGNSGFSEALVLSKTAKKVYIIVRSKIKAEKYLVDQVLNKDNIQILIKKQPLEFLGDNKLQKIRLKDLESGKIEELEVDGVFIAIGLQPNIDLSKKLGVELENGFIKTKPDQSTNVPGVFAAGDITTNSNNFNQFITAAAEGAIAANSAFKYLLQFQ